MKLSEAIRLGSMNTSQGFGAFSVHSTDAPCAIGAALQAVGHLAELSNAFGVAYSEWPCLLDRVVDPVTGSVEILLDVIWMLNDRHHWNRQRIADWVQTVEQAREAPATQPVTVEAL